MKLPKPKYTSPDFRYSTDVLPSNTKIAPSQIKAGDYAFGSYDLFPHIIGGEVKSLTEDVRDGHPCAELTGGIGVRIQFALPAAEGARFLAFLEATSAAHRRTVDTLRIAQLSAIKQEAERLSA